MELSTAFRFQRLHAKVVNDVLQACKRHFPEDEIASGWSFDAETDRTAAVVDADCEAVSGCGFADDEIS